MNKPLYELAILGAVPEELARLLTTALQSAVEELGLIFGNDVSLFIGEPNDFSPEGDRCAGVLCFPIDASAEGAVNKLKNRGVTVIPVASSSREFIKEFPASVACLNGLCRDAVLPESMALALLECVSLLPRQRRVFLSYRRTESTDAALQLYAALSARQYDVFLDTHDIHPGKHFQEMLWQRLSDCDVLLYLDTPTYFESRWTDAEFGRAAWRGISLVRIGWPGVELKRESQLAKSVELVDADFLNGAALLKDEVLASICKEVELVRTRSVAMRYQSLYATLEASVTRGKGVIEGISLRRSILVKTATGKRIAVYPSLGVPTAYTLHDATKDKHPPPVAVVYDDAGVDEKDWNEHMQWITEHVNKSVRLVRGHRAGFDFIDWE